MHVVMQDKTMNVREREMGLNSEVLNGDILGFEDAEYYPEKYPDQRLRPERIPVR